jgi:hypothetical protein
MSSGAAGRIPARGPRAAAASFLQQHPGLPTTWTRVLERNPQAMNPEPLSGYVWRGRTVGAVPEMMSS